MIRRGILAVLVCTFLLLLGLPILLGASQENVYIVHLKQPSLVERVLDMTRGRPAIERRGLLASASAKAYRDEVHSGQQSFIRQLDEKGLLRTAQHPQGILQLLERRSYLVNMLVVRCGAEAAEDLAKLAQVRGIFENREFRAQLDTAPAILGAPTAWELLGGRDMAGAGIKIGVIDSGIAHQHPMFRPDGLTPPPGFPRRRTDFANAKVIVAENYVRTQFGYNQQDEQSPRPEFGHGTQVAGAAAGRPVDSSLAHLSGIAPGAFLGNYKVFGDPEVNASARLAGLLAAFNDAVADGMDVINMSLGGGVPANPEQDPFHIAISNAVDLGIVVVISAGNEGPGNETIGSPGINPDALTVGSVSNGRIFGRIMEVSPDEGRLPDGLSNVTFVAGTGVMLSQDIGPLPMRSALEADPSELACSPLPPGSLSGIVLVRRGDCFFVDKADNVFAAGAQAMVVYNNQGEAFTMGLPDPMRSFAGPSVMISQQEGEGLRDFLRIESATAILRSAIQSIPIQAEAVSDFSSRGPNFRSRVTGIKPDLVAIGQHVHTATSSSANYVVTQGTSFSAPMVAGGAALVRHRHPSWDARAVKSALVNTAVLTPTLNGQPAGVLERGNGRLDLTRALDVPAVLDPVGFSFGTLTDADLAAPAGAGSSTLTKLFEISNPGDDTVQLEIEAIPVRAVDGTSFTLSSSSLQLAAGQSAALTLGLQLDGATIQGEFEGLLRIREVGSQREVTASYWGLAAIGVDNSVVLRVAKDGSQPFLTLAAALQQAGPGNVIEIADSARYLEPLILDGGGFRRLDGLTLRAATGQSPLLEGNISISDLPNLTLEGLTFGNRVTLTRSGGIVRNNVFSSVAAVGQGGLGIGGDVYHVFGNRFHSDDEQSFSLEAGTAGALIQHNTFGAQPGGPAVQSGALKGRSSLLSIFDNAIAAASAAEDPNLSPEQRAGVVFDVSPSVLFKGNTVADTQAGPGLGAISAGDLLLINNLIRDNQGAGIWLSRFSRASLLGGVIRGNQGAGVQAEGGSPVSAQALRLIENGAGFFSDGSSLSLSNSLIADSDGASGNGIEIQSSSLTVENSTIADNSGEGIFDLDATGVLSNSILFGNAAGDLSAQSDLQASARGNLIGVDPLFADPLNNDYSLTPGSAAIDAGLDDSATSATDLDGRQRRAGNAVDQGALEFDSQQAPALILPVLTVDSAEFVGLAMTNAHRPPGSPQESVSPGGTPTGSGAEIQLRAYDSSGELYGSFETELESESQFSILLTQAFEGLRPGWVEILSSRPDLLSFTLLGRPGAAGLEFLDGAALSTAQQGPLLLPEVRNDSGEDTWIYLVNPSPSSVDVLIEWLLPDGSIRQEIRSLDAGGMFSSTVRELFGVGTQGLIRLTTDAPHPLYALEIFGTSRSRGGLLALESSSAAATLFGAQLALGPSIETFIQAVPEGTDELIFEAFDESGQVVSTATVASLTAGTATRLAARSLFDFSEAQSFVGWLQVRATNGGTVLGSISFEHPQGDFLAALPLQSQGAREFVLSHVAENDQIFTGLTLLNPNLTPTGFPTTAAVSVEVFDRSGSRVGLALLRLAAGEKQARLLSELAPQLGQRDNGFVRIRSNLPVLGFELFGNNNSTFLSAVPAQRLVR